MIVIRCFLAQIVGDNLGIHAYLGYTENFSRSNFLCDLGLVNQDEMQNVFLENKLNPRTKDIFDEHVDQLTQLSRSETLSSIWMATSQQHEVDN